MRVRFAPTRLVRALPFPYRAPAIPRGVEPPRRKARKGGAYDTDWARRWPARATRLVLLNGVDAAGREGPGRPDRSGAWTA